MRRTCRLFLSIVFACGVSGVAQADAMWGVDVTGDTSTACELKKPLSVTPDIENLGNIWVGFYWLRDESQVPGYMLPANQIVLIIKSEQDMVHRSNYIEPVQASIGTTQLKKYKFNAVAGGHAFFFMDGDQAYSIFDSLRKGTPFEIHFQLPDSSLRKVGIHTSPDDHFAIYAEMFLTCSEGLRS